MPLGKLYTAIHAKVDKKPFKPIPMASVWGTLFGYMYLFFEAPEKFAALINTGTKQPLHYITQPFVPTQHCDLIAVAHMLFSVDGIINLACNPDFKPADFSTMGALINAAAWSAWGDKKDAVLTVIVTRPKVQKAFNDLKKVVLDNDMFPPRYQMLLNAWKANDYMTLATAAGTGDVRAAMHEVVKEKTGKPMPGFTPETDGDIPEPDKKPEDVLNEPAPSEQTIAQYLTDHYEEHKNVEVAMNTTKGSYASNFMYSTPITPGMVFKNTKGSTFTLLGAYEQSDGEVIWVYRDNDGKLQDAVDEDVAELIYSSTLMPIQYAQTIVKEPELPKFTKQEKEWVKQAHKYDVVEDMLHPGEMYCIMAVQDKKVLMAGLNLTTNSVDGLEVVWATFTVLGGRYKPKGSAWDVKSLVNHLVPGASVKTITTAMLPGVTGSIVQGEFTITPVGTASVIHSDTDTVMTVIGHYVKNMDWYGETIPMDVFELISAKAWEKVSTSYAPPTNYDPSNAGPVPTGKHPLMADIEKAIQASNAPVVTTKFNITDTVNDAIVKNAGALMTSAQHFDVYQGLLNVGTIYGDSVLDVWRAYTDGTAGTKIMGTLLDSKGFLEAGWKITVGINLSLIDGGAYSIDQLDAIPLAYVGTVTVSRPSELTGISFYMFGDTKMMYAVPAFAVNAPFCKAHPGCGFKKVPESSLKFNGPVVTLEGCETDGEVMINHPFLWQVAFEDEWGDPDKVKFVLPYLYAGKLLSPGMPALDPAQVGFLCRAFFTTGVKQSENSMGPHTLAHVRYFQVITHSVQTHITKKDIEWCEEHYTTQYSPDGATPTSTATPEELFSKLLSGVVSAWNENGDVFSPASVLFHNIKADKSVLTAMLEQDKNAAIPPDMDSVKAYFKTDDTSVYGKWVSYADGSAGTGVVLAKVLCHYKGPLSPMLFVGNYIDNCVVIVMESACKDVATPTGAAFVQPLMSASSVISGTATVLLKSLMDGPLSVSELHKACITRNLVRSGYLPTGPGWKYGYAAFATGLTAHGAELSYASVVRSFSIPVVDYGTSAQAFPTAANIAAAKAVAAANPPMKNVEPAPVEVPPSFDYTDSVYVDSLSNTADSFAIIKKGASPGGSNPNYLVKGPGNTQWFFKSSKDEFQSRVIAEACVYPIAKTINSWAVPAGTVKMKGVQYGYTPFMGDLQPVPAKTGELSASQKSRLLAQHALDMFLTDHDGGVANWAIKNGALIPVDRGQSLKYYVFGDGPVLDPNYTPQGVASGKGYAKQLLINWADGSNDIPASAWMAMRIAIQRIEAIPDDLIDSCVDKFEELLQGTPDDFIPTKAAKVKKGMKLARDGYLEKWTTVLKKLRSDFEWPVVQKGGEAVVNVDPKDMGLKKEHEKHIAEAVQGGWMGKSIFIDKSYIENMEVQVREVDYADDPSGSATMIHFRVSRQGGEKAEQLMSAVAVEKSYAPGIPLTLPFDKAFGTGSNTDFYHAIILRATKHFNWHILGWSVWKNEAVKPDGVLTESIYVKLFEAQKSLQELLTQCNSNPTGLVNGVPAKFVKQGVMYYLDQVKIIATAYHNKEDMAKGGGGQSAAMDEFPQFTYTLTKDQVDELMAPASDAKPKSVNIQYMKGQAFDPEAYPQFKGKGKQPRIVVQTADVAKWPSAGVLGQYRVTCPAITGARIYYTPVSPKDGDAEVKSYFGQVWGIIPGKADTKSVAQLLKMFEAATGIDMGASTKDDKEVLFLSKQAFLLQGVSSDISPVSGSGATDPTYKAALAAYAGGDVEKAKVGLRSFVSDRLSIELGTPIKPNELDDLPNWGEFGYTNKDDQGNFNALRLGWDDKTLSKATKNVFVGHKLLKKTPLALFYALTENNGGLISAVTYSSCGLKLPLEGVEGVGANDKKTTIAADLKQGATSIFCVLSQGGRKGSGWLYFDNSVLLRSDSYIVGLGDGFGNVEDTRITSIRRLINNYASRLTASPDVSPSGGAVFQFNVRGILDMRKYLHTCYVGSNELSAVKSLVSGKWGADTTFAKGRTIDEVFVESE